MAEEQPFMELRRLCQGSTTSTSDEEHDEDQSRRWLEAHGGVPQLVSSLLASEKEMKKTRRRSKKKKQEQQTSVFDTEGQGPIHKAADSGRQQVLEYLLREIQAYMTEHYEDTTERDQLWEQIVDARDKSWKTPLMLAAAEYTAGAHTEAIQTLLRFGANPNERKPNGWTALLYACKASSVDAITALVNSGANTSVRNREKATPLYISAREASEFVVAYLIDHCKGDPVTEATANGRTPLHVAISNANPNVLPVLLDRVDPGQLPDIKDNSYHTLHHEAADVGSISNTQQLERYGFAFWDAGPSIADQFPIQLAVLRAHEDFVRYVIGYLQPTREIDASMQLNKALYDSAAKGSGNIMEILLDHGADPNFCGPRRSTLHTAAFGGSPAHVECVKVLLRHNASLSVLDCDVKTPLEATEAFLDEVGFNEHRSIHQNIDASCLRETIELLKAHSSPNS